MVQDRWDYEGIFPKPAAHGVDFTAAYLDLVEVAYGSDARRRLRQGLLGTSAPVDEVDCPLYEVPPGKDEHPHLMQAYTEPHPDWRPPVQESAHPEGRAASALRSSASDAVRTTRPQCACIGPKSRCRCVRASGHAPPHRYQ